MSKTGSFLCVLLVMAAFSFVQAQNDSGGGRVVLPDGVQLIPHAYAHFEAGQIEQGNLKNDDIQTNGSQYGIDHVWTEDADLEFGFAAKYHERLKMEMGLGAKLYFSYPIFASHDKNTKYLRTDIYFDQAFAQYHFGSAESPWLLAQIGYFKFKYNPDVRNLGEYMFRTGTYPIYFDMGFDFPLARLLGVHLQSNLFNSLKLDALLASATVFPTMNWSLAVLADYDIAALHFINIGAGVDFADLLDVYTGHSFLSYGGDPTSFKSTSYNTQYIAANGDTNYYTFQGTKIMGRISIDPKAFFHWKYFGENDLKLYAEADLIGLESYPDSGIQQGGTYGLVAPSYNKWQEKMPIAIGFNVPTFKALDVLNVEMEWFRAKYYNDASNVFGKSSQPLPYSVSVYGVDPSAPQKSQIKWSVYAKKSFLNGHFAVIGQVGRDHLRLSSPAYDYEYWNELLVTANDWWWVLKTSWMF